jgi:hypothetical protein
VIAACGAFGSQGDDPTPAAADGGTPPDGAAPDGAAPDGAAAPDAAPASIVIRCGATACNTPQKCCLPLYNGSQDAGCAPADAVCGAEVAELLCSDPAACNAGEVCCLTSKLNPGQTGFVVFAASCVSAPKCLDGPTQRNACRAGGPSDQCQGGMACKQYLEDTSGTQPKPVDTVGYSTCQ